MEQLDILFPILWDRKQEGELVTILLHNMVEIIVLVLMLKSILVLLETVQVSVWGLMIILIFAYCPFCSILITST